MKDKTAQRDSVALKPLSETAVSLPLSGIRKFFDLASSMEDVISLGVGEPDFQTPWVGRETAIYSIERGQTTYSANQGLIELRQEIDRRYQRLYNLSFDPKTEILVTVGASQALDLACRAILNPGDEVLLPEPCFVAYKPIVLLAGGKPVTIRTESARDFAFSIEDLKKASSNKTKAILIGHPSNPTGASLSRELLEDLVRFAEERGLYIISDEIYDRLSYDGDHTCVAGLDGARDRTVVVNGFSKTYAMTGWRLGYALAPRAIIEVMTRIHSHTMMCAPTPSQRAAVAILKSGDRSVNDMVMQYKQRRNLIVDGLNKLGLTCRLPAGAFYAFPSIRSTGLSSEDFARELLLREGVALVPGSVFGECGEGHVRCSYATSTRNIEEALSRIGKFLSSL